MTDLVTLAQAKNYIQPDGGEDDEVLQTLISWASDLVRSWTQRPFTTPPVTETRLVQYRQYSGKRMLDRLTDVTQVKAPLNYFVEGEPYPFEDVLSPDDYDVEQYPTHTTLKLAFPANGKVEVTGTWGWEVIPGDLQMACTITADEWYRSNVISGYSDSQGESEGRNIFLPREIQEVLQPWRGVELLA